MAWLDNNRLLVDKVIELQVASIAVNTGVAIYDAAGTQLATPPIPNGFGQIRPVTADSVYSLYTNSIVTLTTGADGWESANPSEGVGGVTASQAIFASGNLVLAQPF